MLDWERRITPAMAASVTDRAWSLDELGGTNLSGNVVMTPRYRMPENSNRNIETLR